MSISSPNPPSAKALPSSLAAALVFFCSGTVLVLEILGVRLLAPFVGSSLDTYTAIIGTVLAGISAGTYLGGRLADRIDPRRMLGPVLMISGATTLFIVPAIRIFGSALGSSSAGSVVMLSIIGLLIPAAVLSAISPIVVKLQLNSLRETGATVGRLSAIGTAGAIGGTFLTGFVLLVHFRTSAIVITIGVVLVLAGLAFALWNRQAGFSTPVAAASLALVTLGVPLTSSAGSYCDTESPYYCMRLVKDRDRPTGNFLQLDRLLHSYVDLTDPTLLDFWYIETMATAFDTLQPDPDAQMLTVGGGGFTLPRYLSATRPGSSTTSLEIDPALVEFNEQKLGLETVERLDVKVGDARSTIDTVPAHSFDIVVGDAFGNESVPWHLSTVEFARQIRRTMTDEAILVLNIIDFGSRDLLKAEMATLQQVFPEVALIERRINGEVVDGNFVVLASAAPIDSAALSPKLAALDEPSYLVEGAELERMIAGAPVLTDDFAPADQLLARNLRTAR